MQLSNYLFFTTMCEPALGFYKKCGLGEIVTLMRWGENGMPVRVESMRGKIMHAQFEGPGVRFFASDNDDAEPMRGSAMIFSLEDREQTDHLFGQLSEGGQVTTSLAIQPWVALPADTPAVAEYHDRKKYWPAGSLARRGAAAHVKGR